MLSRLILVIALLAGLALFIQAPARASDRDGDYRHDRYVEAHRAPRHYQPHPVYDRYYRPVPVYRDAPRYRHAHRPHRHHRHCRHHRDRYYYSDRRW